ncbi:MAG: hypothetical protein ACFCD0_00860 [Gemmataceae bacterium]
MIAFTIAFGLLLIDAHLAEDIHQALATPLSVFRDGKQSTLGFCLFALMLIIGGFMTWLMIRLSQERETVVFLTAEILLLIVVATQSWDVGHLICSFLLLGLLYGYYAIILLRIQFPLFVGHLCLPVLISYMTQFHSFGLWQKSMILYFLLAINIHYYVIVFRHTQFKNSLHQKKDQERKVIDHHLGRLRRYKFRNRHTNKDSSTGTPT